MLVEPLALPPLNAKGPIAVTPLGPLPACATRETTPAGVPLAELTPMVNCASCPCVRVMGFVAGLVARDKVTELAVKFDFQLFTRLAALSDPSPVAKS